MYLAILLAVLASLTVAQAMPVAEVARPFFRLSEVVFLTSVLCAALLAIFARFARRFEKTDNPFELAKQLKQFHRVRNAGVWSWAAIAPCIVAVTEWPMLVRFNLGVGQALLLDELLTLAPVLLSLFTFWFALSGVEQTLLARRMDDESAPTRGSLFAMQARHYGGFLLAPMLFALLVGDLTDLYREQIHGFEWLIAIAFVVGLVILFPLALRLIWPTAPLAQGPLRHRLEATSLGVGMNVREILIWKTSGRLVNAAVVGFAGMFRYLMLTDELLNQLSDEQIESVLLHEAAHVRRRHLIVRMCLIGLPLASWGVAMTLLFGDPTSLMVFEPSLLSDSAWLAVVGPLLLGVYCVAAFCWVSRLLEFDADLIACQMGAKRGANRAQYVSMLETLADASGARRDKRSWLHPSIDERVSLLASLDHSTQQVDSFQRSFHATVGVFVLLAAAAPAWIVLSTMLSA